jgi:hypothetical protein
MLERTNYHGWENSCRLSNGTVEAIVLADVGPRVIFYGFCGGENQFHEVADQQGLCGGNEFRLYGGRRLWIAPEGKSTYYPDNHPVSVTESANGVCFIAPMESNPDGRALVKKVAIQLGQGSQMRVMHTVTNTGSFAVELSAWGPTMMRGGGRAILPLSPRAAIDDDHLLPVSHFSIWSYTDFSDSRWTLGGEFIQLRHDAHPKGRFPEQMGGIYNPCEWGAYYRDGCLFVKRARVIAGARYPDFGCNFELFTNRDFLELETLAPLTELQPGQSTSHEEVWTLFADVPDGSDESWIRSTVLPLVASR